MKNFNFYPSLLGTLSLALATTLQAQDTLTLQDGFNYLVIKEGNRMSPQMGQEVEYSVVMYHPESSEIMMKTEDLGYHFFDILDQETAMEWGTFGKMKVGDVHRNMTTKEMIDDPYLQTMPGDKIIGEITLIKVMDAKVDGADLLKETVNSKGVEAAQEKFAAIQQKGTSDIVFREANMNAAGYQFLAMEKVDTLQTRCRHVADTLQTRCRHVACNVSTYVSTWIF